MYSTAIGKSAMQWDSREAAYRAAYDATREGWHYISIKMEEELECRVILKEDGGVVIWTPELSDKWECSKFLRDVNGLNDVIFRN